MDVCESCGARLSPDVDWCGQCYAPVPGRGEAGSPPGAEGDSPHGDPDPITAGRASGFSALSPEAKLATAGVLAVLALLFALFLRPGGPLALILPIALSATAIAVLVDAWKHQPPAHAPDPTLSLGDHGWPDPPGGAGTPPDQPGSTVSNA